MTARDAEGDRPFGEEKHTDEQDKDKDRVAVEVEAEFKVGSRSRSRFGSKSKSRGQQCHQHRRQSINQSINQSSIQTPSSPPLSPALSFHIPFKPAGPGRCGTDPARFKLSLFPDRHQVRSRQTAAVETKTPKRHDRQKHSRRHTQLIELHLGHTAHTVRSAVYSSHPHISHTTHHTTARIRLLCSMFYSACTTAHLAHLVHLLVAVLCCAVCLSVCTTVSGEHEHLYSIGPVGSRLSCIPSPVVDSYDMTGGLPALD